MQMFTGSDERQLDPKGRVALPVSYRERLKPRCFVTFGQDMCLEVLTEQASKDVLEEMAEAVKRGERHKAELRVVSANMAETVLDAQGRITLNETLRSYAGLTPGQQLIVAGAYDRIELWDPERFARMSAIGTGQIAGEGNR
ncbi:MAG: hypothetical protein WAS51_03175 [Ilumatobacteraceae bacterium]|nr:MAG: cell division/cell wall cluster transcriptional repressor MraZ [Actinomycetota bacterium]